MLLCSLWCSQSLLPIHSSEWNFRDLHSSSNGIAAAKLASSFSLIENWWKKVLLHCITNPFILTFIDASAIVTRREPHRALRQIVSDVIETLSYALEVLSPYALLFDGPLTKRGCLPQKRLLQYNTVLRPAFFRSPTNNHPAFQLVTYSSEVGPWLLFQPPIVCGLYPKKGEILGERPHRIRFGLKKTTPSRGENIYLSLLSRINRFASF